MGLSVKATEGLVREQKEARSSPHTEKEPGEPAADDRSSHIKSMENDIRQRLATHVEIKIRGKDKGQIVISFETNDDFMRVMDVLRR
jgi:ParB family transcriptional regulator, chromosome partitioning protein